MEKFISFEEWLQSRDELDEAMTPTARKWLGAATLGAASLGGYFGMGSGDNPAPSVSHTPAAHVQQMPAQPPSTGGGFKDFMTQSVDPVEPPAIPSSYKRETERKRWDASEQLKLLQALHDAGITVRGGLRTSGVPHGTTIDVNGDDIPDNPQENYFNTGDRTYYGKSGKAQWTWDGRNIHQAK